MKPLALLLVVVVSVWGVDAQDEDNKIPWTYFQTNGNEVQLYCNDSKDGYQPYMGDTLMWARSDDDHNIRIPIEEGDMSKYKFEEGMGLERLFLTVKNIQPSDYGAYYCAVYNQSMDLVFELRKGINVDGPQFNTIGEKYQTPVTIGCVSASVLLGLVLLIGFVYKFRYREEDSSYDIGSKNLYDTDLSKVNPNAFDNPALYVPDEDQTKENIEMNASISNGKEEITTM